ncbi:alpha/beta fold hydrolase [Moraxella cuniculi]|uniref:Alpha/beta hydrolase family n=1 Tax=Moraxella cuniculi TaxID=34061 RepID=A0A448GYB5_9GAMM|nr:alpha/beta hydrolase [Moraxella cuniculi]VEG13816.1 Alpha/beta hydrolase family [Moraxella cuniculi]
MTDFHPSNCLDTAALSTLPKSQLTGKPVLHFVHANGIPVGSYQPLLDCLADFFSISHLDKLGTHDEYAIDNHWQSLTRQVADSIQASCQTHGVSKLIAIGHSLGAMTTLQALPLQSKRISQAILLDPALLMTHHALLFDIAKLLDNCSKYFTKTEHYFGDKFSPAGKSKHRKDTFSSHQAAYLALRHKALFRDFDESCFEHYIRHGFVADGNGAVTLAIPKMAEVAIFRTMPSWYWRKKPQLPCPVGILAGKDSYFTRIGSYRAAQEKFALPVQYTTGSHMFVLEQPQAVATKILSMIIHQLDLTHD